MHPSTAYNPPVARRLRHDRSEILYPELRAPAQPGRRSRCLNILALRAARTTYHVLADRGSLADTAGQQVRSRLRALAAQLGICLVIAGAQEKAKGVAEVN